MRRLLAQVVVVALFAVAFVSGAAAQKIDKIVFFGDSLTDTGNNFLLTGKTTTIPFAETPAAYSYHIVNEYEYSNGQVWSELLADGLGLPLSGLPSLQTKDGQYTNYAVGEARSRANAPAFPDYDLSTQVAIFLSNYHGVVPPNTLVAIWIGSNDLEDALDALTVDPSGGASEAILNDATAAILQNLELLYQQGARMFVVANIPDLSKTPYVRYLGQTQPTIPVIASTYTMRFNTVLAAETAGFKESPGLQYFLLFDANALLNLVMASPDKFHLVDVTDRCTVPLVTSNAICSKPDTYLFWDATHPTTAGHFVIAKTVYGLLPPQHGNGKDKGRSKGEGRH